MATVSASLRNSPGQLWQFPLFFLGVASIVAVWYLRPLWRLSPADRYLRDLAPLRQAIDKTPPDPGQVQGLLRKVQSSEPPGELLAQTQYLVGSAYMVLAEGAATTEDATQYWGLARKYLEAAQLAGIPEADQIRHSFRLAKTWAMNEVEPAKVIEALLKISPVSDDVPESNRVLAEMYLKLKPPEHKKARDSLKEYLSRVLPARTETQNKILNQARLQQGELCIELNDLDEARRVLDRIGADAPIAILVAAKILLAKSYQKDLEWGQAIRVWEQAKALKDLTPVQKSTILFQLADCYLHGNRRTEALAALDELRKSGGNEALASALKLAELQLNDSAQRLQAVLTLESALPKLANPEQFQNPLLDLTEARGIYEDAAESYREAGEYALSIRVARAYARIADKGRDRELAAEALEAWGLSLLNPATGDGPAGARAVEEGIKKVREAAEEWRALSALKTAPTEKGDLLRRAADLYLKVGNLTDAIKMLDEFTIHVNNYPEERMAEFWLQKGELYLKADNKDQARASFLNGVKAGGDKNPSPKALRCQVRLAEMAIQSKDAKKVASAKDDLEKILSKPDLAANDKDLHELALTLFADALVQREEYGLAEARYSEVLSNHSNGAKANYAQFQLAYCYYREATQESARCREANKIRNDPATSNFRKQEAETKFEQCNARYLQFLKKAFDAFKNSETALQQAGQKLTQEDAILLRRASLIAADCAYYLGNYEESMERYDKLTRRYSGTVVALEAFKQMYECKKFLKDFRKANELFLQMRLSFEKMHESAFDGSSLEHTRAYWLKWFEENQK
jgi:tetratricopeptide (TPR) repeat protein